MDGGGQRRGSTRYGARYIGGWMAREAMEDGWNKQRVGLELGGKISLTRGAWEMWCKVRLARKCNPLRRWPFHTTRPLAASSFGRLGTFVGLLLGYSNCRSPLLLKLRVQKRTTLDVQRRYYQSHSFGCSRRVPSLGHCFSAILDTARCLLSAPSRSDML